MVNFIVTAIQVAMTLGACAMYSSIERSIGTGPAAVIVGAITGGVFYGIARSTDGGR